MEKKKGKISSCVHVGTIGDNTWEDVVKHKQGQKRCEQCGKEGPNLWLCLHHRCLFVGCGEAGQDCSTRHTQECSHHLTLNLTSMRIWCYTCEFEVYKDSNVPEFNMKGSHFTAAQQRMMHDQLTSHEEMCPNGALGGASVSRPLGGHPTDREEDVSDEDDDEEDEDMDRPRGLAGLQNIGNTCYMNSALQALSNCPPLMRFFRDCPGFVPQVSAGRKPLMSRSFHKLISDIWHKRRPSHLTPSSIAGGIKILYPMFRGYTQQDTQEFLRCFMDQLHEELKQPFIGEDTSEAEQEEEEEMENTNENCRNIEAERQPSHLLHVTSKVKNSDNEYETCESAQSSERSSVESSDNTNSQGVPVVVTESSHNTENKQQQPTTEGHPEATNKPQTSDGDTEKGDGDAQQEGRVACGNGVPGQGRNQEVASEMSNKVIAESESESYRPPLTRGSQKNKSDVNRTVSKDSGIGNFNSEISVASPSNSELQQSGSQPSREPADVVSSERSLKHIQVQPNTVSSFTDVIKPSPTGKPGSRSRQVSETDRATSKPGIQTIKTSHMTTTKKKKKAPTEYHSVISDVFDGKLHSSVQCLTCERISTTKETFQDLSLPIPTKDHIQSLHGQAVCQTPGPAPHHKGACGEVSMKQGWFSWWYTWMRSWFWGPSVKLQDCLAAFFSADELKGDNMYSCEKCKKLRNGSKYSKVLQLPEVLCIHLKRFRHEFMFSTKVGTPVTFPMDGLDMRPYLDKDCKDEETQYDLVSVICHHGTAGGGHYTSYALNYINETWYEFDDQFVSSVDLQTVENCEAYVLFYRKKNEHMLTKRTKASEIALRQENSFMKFYISRQWINKFNTFAEPGPISNHDFICRHGGVHPYKYNTVGLLAMEVSQPMWEYLYTLYGGGPAVTHLYSCTTCKEEIDKLKYRQKMEKDIFVKMNEEFTRDESTSAIYAISMSWFKDWENFVRDRTEEPPGPIENSRICVVKGGVALLRHHSDYGQVSEEMWNFLYDIYGGGPEIVTRPTLKVVQQQQQYRAMSSERDETSESDN